MNDATPDHPGLLNWILILTLGVVWGAAFMSVSVALDGYAVLSVAAGRVALGAVALCLIGAVIGQGLGRLNTRRHWVFAGIIGIVTVALPFTLLAWGQQHVPSAFAGVAMGAVPLLVLPLVAIFSPEEGIGPRRIAGFIVGFVGLAILIGPGALRPAGGDLEPLGRLACLGAAACYAIGSVVTRRAPPVQPIAFASATLVFAAAVLVPLAVIIDGIPTSVPLAPTWALIYAALFPTALAAVIRVRVIKTAGSMFMSLTSYMVPVWSVIFGVTLMSEALPPQLFYALGLILLGIAIAQSRAWVSALRKGR